MSQSAEFPSRETFLDENGRVAPRPLVWFRDLRSDVNLGSSVVAGSAVSLQNKSAAVATTPFPTAALSSGQYRISAFTQIITAASINSSVIVTFSFTKNTVACTVTTPALTTNDSTRPGSFVGLITIDAATPVSYATTYVSNAAGMTYDVDLLLEKVNT